MRHLEMQGPDLLQHVGCARDHRLHMEARRHLSEPHKPLEKQGR